jgi:hypothetical protein
MPANDAEIPDVDLGLLLVGFQAGDTQYAESFFRVVSPRLKRIARRHLPDLPPDIQNELVGETLMLLLQPMSARFNAVRGTAWKYIYGFALNAAKAVRSQNGRPRRVRRPNGAAVETQQPKVVSLQELNEEPGYEESVDHRIAADQVLARASATVRVALERIYFDDEPRVRVAEQLGIDRFALNRQLSAFSDLFKEVRLGA